MQDIVEVPPELYQKQRRVDICIDVMFINGIAFFTTVAKRILYRTAQFLPARNEDAILTALKEVHRLYLLQCSEDRILIARMRSSLH